MAATLTNLLVHSSLAPRIENPSFGNGFRDELEKYVAGIIRNEGGIMLGIAGMPDHLHVVTKFKPDRSVAEMVRLIKANSSKWANEKHRKQGQFAWQAGYGAFSVSQSQLECFKIMSLTSRRTTARGRSRTNFAIFWTSTGSSTTNNMFGDRAPELYDITPSRFLR